MKQLLKTIVALLLVVTATHAASAYENVSISVTPAFAPNGNAPNGSSSPSWPGYVERATDALAAGASSIGDRNLDPSAYEAVIGPINPFEMIYTEYNSWRASADPFPTWSNLPAAFDQEQGNRIHFGLQIATDGASDFALHDLSWSLDSNDDTDYFDQSGSFASGSYSSTRVGTNYGPDGLPGGGDDIVYDNGQDGSLKIHELTYVGVGDGFLSMEPAPASDIDDINATLRTLLQSCISCSFDLTATYTLADANGGVPLIGSGAVEVLIEPGYGSDFNRNFSLDSGDLDILTRQVDAASTDILYDLDRDGVIDFEDLRIAVQELHYTYFGDANDDGQFSSNDLIQVFVAGLYENGDNDDAVWSTGDWNGDGEFGSSDLIIAFQDGGYETGPRPAVQASAMVPEPSAALLAMTGMICLLLSRRRRG